MGLEFFQKLLNRINILNGIYKITLYFTALCLGVILLNFALRDMGIGHNMAIALSLIGNIILQKIFFAIHETGHALAIKAVNYNLHVLRVGHIGFNFKPFRFRRFKSASCDDYGGYVLMSPSRGEWSRKKDVIILLAGSGLSLCFAIICLFASFAYIDVEGAAFIYESFGPIKTVSFLYLFMSWPAGILLTCTVYGISDALTNYMPDKSGLIPNDGAQIISRLKAPYWNDQTWAQTLMQFEVYEDIPMSDETLSDVKDIILSSPWSSTGAQKELMARVAWRRTQHSLFLEILNEKNTDFSLYPNEIYHMYVASLVLAGDIENPAFSDFQTQGGDTQTYENSSVFWFAKSLVNYAHDNFDLATQAALKCRKIILKHYNHIPKDDEDILAAIQNRRALPSWV